MGRWGHREKGTLSTRFPRSSGRSDGKVRVGTGLFSDTSCFPRKKGPGPRPPDPSDRPTKTERVPRTGRSG